MIYDDDKNGNQLYLISIAGMTAELDWFQFETEMRKVVRDLLEPTIQRSHEDRERTNNFRILIDSMEDRVNHLETIVLKKGEKLSVFEEINNRIFLNEQHR